MSSNIIQRYNVLMDQDIFDGPYQFLEPVPYVFERLIFEEQGIPHEQQNQRITQRWTLRYCLKTIFSIFIAIIGFNLIMALCETQSYGRGRTSKLMRTNILMKRQDIVPLTFANGATVRAHHTHIEIQPPSMDGKQNADDAESADVEQTTEKFAPTRTYKYERVSTTASRSKVTNSRVSTKRSTQHKISTKHTGVSERKKLASKTSKRHGTSKVASKKSHITRATTSKSGPRNINVKASTKSTIEPVDSKKVTSTIPSTTQEAPRINNAKGIKHVVTKTVIMTVNGTIYTSNLVSTHEHTPGAKETTDVKKREKRAFLPIITMEYPDEDHERPVPESSQSTVTSTTSNKILVTRTQVSTPHVAIPTISTLANLTASAEHLNHHHKVSSSSYIKPSVNESTSITSSASILGEQASPASASEPTPSIEGVNAFARFTSDSSEPISATISSEANLIVLEVVASTSISDNFISSSVSSTVSSASQTGIQNATSTSAPTLPTDFHFHPDFEEVSNSEPTEAEPVPDIYPEFPKEFLEKAAIEESENPHLLTKKGKKPADSHYPATFFPNGIDNYEVWSEWIGECTVIKRITPKGQQHLFLNIWGPQSPIYIEKDHLRKCNDYVEYFIHISDQTLANDLLELARNDWKEGDGFTQGNEDEKPGKGYTAADEIAGNVPEPRPPNNSNDVAWSQEKSSSFGPRDSNTDVNSKDKRGKAPKKDIPRQEWVADCVVVIHHGPLDHADIFGHPGEYKENGDKLNEKDGNYYPQNCIMNTVLIHVEEFHGLKGGKVNDLKIVPDITETKWAVDKIV